MNYEYDIFLYLFDMITFALLTLFTTTVSTWSIFTAAGQQVNTGGYYVIDALVHCQFHEGQDKRQTYRYQLYP